MFKFKFSRTHLSVKALDHGEKKNYSAGLPAESSQSADVGRSLVLPLERKAP
jgi:hypothetical protein